METFAGEIQSQNILSCNFLCLTENTGLALWRFYSNFHEQVGKNRFPNSEFCSYKKWCNRKDDFPWHAGKNGEGISEAQKRKFISSSYSK